MGRAFRQVVTVVFVVPALTSAACTLTFGEPRSPSGAPSTAPSVAPGSPTASAGTISAPGRLAVIGNDERLSTMRADGTDRVPLGDGSAIQPTWSPDGDRLAWVQQVTSDTGVSGSIVVAGPRGEDLVATRAPFLPYYLSWSPTGDRVAFLGAGGDPDAPVEMGVLDLTVDPPRARAISGGDPFFYFAWAPDGRRVLAHAGFDRLEEVDLAGDATSVSDRPGQFAAPAWSADGRTLVYVERAAGGMQRLLAAVGEAAPRVLVEGRGSLSFVLRPDGEAVAYQLLGEDDLDLFDRRPTQAGDGVRVVDVRTGATRQATRIRAMTYWWSPGGNRLLTLAPEPASSDAIPFRWEVWDGRRTSPEAGRHSPTLQLLRDYAPFFTQYAHSTTPWAPDGSAFAYPVETPDDGGRIVVQEVGGEPVPVGEGVYVTWSP